MKRSIAILLFLSAVPASANDDWGTRAPAANLFGGENFPSDSSSGPSFDSVVTQSKPSSSFGISLEVPVGARTAIELGAIFHSRRARETDLSSSVTYTTEFRSTEIPVLFRYEIRPAGDWELDLGLGAFLDTLPDEIEISDSEDPSTIPNAVLKVDPAVIASVEYGPKVAARVRFPIDLGSEFTLQVDYRLGLNDLNRTPENIDHTRLLTVVAGIRLTP